MLWFFSNYYLPFAGLRQTSYCWFWIAVARILYLLGRFMNAGQTCVAPDYVLVFENAFVCDESPYASVVWLLTTQIVGAREHA